MEEKFSLTLWSLRPLPAHVVWPLRAGPGARPAEQAKGAAWPVSPLGHVARPGLRGGTKGGRVAALTSGPPSRGPHRAHGQWPLAACQGISPRCSGVDGGPGVGHGEPSQSCLHSSCRLPLLANDLNKGSVANGGRLKKIHTRRCVINVINTLVSPLQGEIQ